MKFLSLTITNFLCLKYFVSIQPEKGIIQAWRVDNRKLVKQKAAISIELTFIVIVDFLDYRVRSMFWWSALNPYVTFVIYLKSIRLIHEIHG